MRSPFLITSFNEKVNAMKMRSTQALLGLLSFCAVLISPAHAGALMPYTTFFNTDLATAGTGGLRGTGTGTINVSGVTGTVTNSLLYWHGPTNSTNPNANANVNVNGTGVVGTNIGLASDNFWGFANSQAYRANTTNIINGNGTYNLTNFNKPGVEVNGAATLVLFDDGNSANNRDAVVYDGNDSNFASAYDTAGWDINLAGINYTGGSAFLRLFVSDGQNFGPNDDGTLRINGVALASGGLFQGASLPGPSIGNGNLFDIVSFDITPFLTLGTNSLHITLDAGFNDALSAVTAIIDLPAGAAPPVNVPEPGTGVLIVLGLALVGALSRKKSV